MSINEILKDCDFDFKKKFGQNFISDINLLNSIVLDAGITNNDEVLEIGVGAGTLTKAISQKAKKVVGIEIDKSLEQVHKRVLNEADNVTIIFNDFLKLSSDYVNSLFSQKYKVVANLPYYITTPIIFKLIEEDFNITSLSLMVQKEVADRLVSSCGTKNYGAITVQLQSIANIKIARNVNRNMFTPQPNVDSAIVRIDINRDKYKISNYSLHKKLIECAFAMRRKTLSNCLKSYFNLNQEQLSLLFNECNLNEMIRGEALSVEQFVNLSNSLNNILKN